MFGGIVFGIANHGKPSRKEAICSTLFALLADGVRALCRLIATLAWAKCSGIFALCLGAVAAQAQTPDWQPAQALAQQRLAHTATLLPNGQVLVVGGWSGNAFLASAELYDPVTDTWRAASPLAQARSNHTATLLPSGQVLVVGGFGDAVLADAELYDPATNRWSAAQSLVQARYMHTTTLLPNGQVLVLGGYDNRAPLASAEWYEPSSNTWHAAQPLDQARMAHTATLLPDGQVLVVGGASRDGMLASAVLVGIDGHNSAGAPASLSQARHSHTASLLANGQVLVVGGLSHSDVLSSAERYDPATRRWQPAAALAQARYMHAATALPDGQVVVTGGRASSTLNQGLRESERYAPVDNRWASAGALADARHTHTATGLSNGQVLVIGGQGADAPLASGELKGCAARPDVPNSPSAVHQ